MKILVIQQKMIGDVLTSTILFEALREKYPDAELHYLINSNTFPVVEGNPFIDKIVLFDPKTHNSVFSKYRFLQKIKNEKYAVVIDVYSKIFSAFITFFSGAKTRIGKRKWYLNWAYSETIVLSPQSAEISVPMVFVNRFDFLKPLWIDFSLKIKPKIFVSENEKAALWEKLEKASLTKNLLLVNCLGSSPFKTYPLSYMAELLDFIAAAFPEKKILLNYAPDQKETVKELQSFCAASTKNSISDFYVANLRDFIVLCTFCDAVIGNEGGAINIAKALEIRSWAIYSPWIKLESWQHKNDERHVGIHLISFRPELFSKKNKKQLKKEKDKLYSLLKPALLKESLKSFLQKST